MKDTELAAEKQRKTDGLADKAWTETRNELIAALPYMNRAILNMPVSFYHVKEVKETDIGFGTDGTAIRCIPEAILRDFSIPGKLRRKALHTLLHCLYSHPFEVEAYEFYTWSYACDLSVEAVILKLNLPDFFQEEDARRRQLLNELETHVQGMNAESIYAWLKQNSQDAKDMLAYEDLFREDQHTFWKEDTLKGKGSPFADDGFTYSSRKKKKHAWKRLKQDVELEIESFEKSQGYTPGTILKKLMPIPRSGISYREFLKRFVARNETLHVNPEEFDYIYYSYGLQLYETIPLIEPLEYREESKIHDFVIAIDTSGSCQGHIVREFLTKTYDVLASSDSFFDQVNVHILQCDAAIQSDTIIHNLHQFETYMETVQLSGFGGTDFRPAFTYVEQLKKDGAFHDLKGLLYFTDGMGTYPTTVPSFDTAFVFLENQNFAYPQVPPWAMRVIVDAKELGE